MRYLIVLQQAYKYTYQTNWCTTSCSLEALNWSDNICPRRQKGAPPYHLNYCRAKSFSDPPGLLSPIKLSRLLLILYSHMYVHLLA